MAKIEMDISEYEKMKKIESLLEESLVREKGNALMIENLNQEKIDILQKAEKQVIMTTMSSTHQTIYTYHSVDEIIRRIKTFLSNESGRVYRSASSMSPDFHAMLDMFFQKTTQEVDGTTSVMRRGLDEYITTLRVELKEELDETTQRELGALKSMRLSESQRKKEFDDLLKMNKALNSETDNLFEKINHLEKVVETEGKKLEQRDKEYDATQEILGDIQGTIAKQPTGLFIGSMKFKIRLLQLLKEKQNDKG